MADNAYEDLTDNEIIYPNPYPFVDYIQIGEKIQVS